MSDTLGCLVIHSLALQHEPLASAGWTELRPHLLEGEHRTGHSGQIVLGELRYGKPVAENPATTRAEVNSFMTFTRPRVIGARDNQRCSEQEEFFDCRQYPANAHLSVDWFPRPHKVYICGVSSRARSPTSMSVNGAKLSTSSSPHKFFRVGEGVKVGATCRKV